YFLPSGNLARFERWLERVGDYIRRLHSFPILIAENFNAWSRAWDSRATNARGETLGEWAAALGLVLLNRGRVSTCVRPQEKSIVDLTWA
ncbi:hypothetical protein EAG_10462, partial [Camponotus floridanus]